MIRSNLYFKATAKLYKKYGGADVQLPLQRHFSLQFVFVYIYAYNLTQLAPSTVE